MILDNLGHFNEYHFPEELQKTLQFLKGAVHLKDGRYDLEDGIFVLIQSYCTRERKDCRIEAHKRYVDLQYIIDGNERVGIRSDGKIFVPYNPENDIEFYEGESNWIDLHRGDYIVLFPQDRHQPCMGDGSPVKKAVVKIPVELFLKY